MGDMAFAAATSTVTGKKRGRKPNVDLAKVREKADSYLKKLRDDPNLSPGACSLEEQTIYEEVMLALYGETILDEISQLIQKRTVPPNAANSKP